MRHTNATGKEVRAPGVDLIGEGVLRGAARGKRAGREGMCCFFSSWPLYTRPRLLAIWPDHFVSVLGLRMLVI